MSHIPSSAMKHAHAAPAPSQEASPVKRAVTAAERISPPVWTSIAAGVAGAVGAALFLSLRSSTPARKPTGRRAAKGRAKGGRKARD